MKRILFVDDEPKILMGLRRSLRCYRGEWEMCFAEGGGAALEQCARGPFDVVVSDARMPGMDGSALLSEVLSRYPDTVRIVLSGQCSEGSVLKCVGVAHQFLSKPCAPETLRAVVQRVCAMRDAFQDESLRRAMSSVKWLPSQADIYRRLVNRIAAPDVTIDDAAEIIACDVAMSARVVYLVSSGFFGSPQRVVNAAHAARLLGLERIKSLMTVSAIFAPQLPTGSANDAADVNHHSSTVARAARHIVASMTNDRTTIGDGELAGMLHQVGRLALGGRAPGGETPGDISMEHRATMDPGGYLVALWGLPDPVVQAVSYYQTPLLCAEQVFGPLTAVHVADACLGQLFASVTGQRTRLDIEYLRRIGCADRVENWRHICHTCLPEGAVS